MSDYQETQLEQCLAASWECSCDYSQLSWFDTTVIHSFLVSLGLTGPHAESLTWGINLAFEPACVTILQNGLDKSHIRQQHRKVPASLTFAGANFKTIRTSPGACA